MRFILDNVEQSNAELSDKWPTNRNIFIGAEYITAPDGTYDGKIGDVSYKLKSSLKINLRRLNKYMSIGI